jgi:hypothetical protein
VQIQVSVFIATRVEHKPPDSHGEDELLGYEYIDKRKTTFACIPQDLFDGTSLSNRTVEHAKQLLKADKRPKKVDIDVNFSDLIVRLDD